MSAERPIDCEVTLASLVARVREKVTQNPEEGAEQYVDLDGQVQFPSEFENCEAEAKWVTYEKRPPYWSVDIQAFRDFEPEALDAILRRNLQRLQLRPFKKGFADLRLKCSWDSEDFLGEKQLSRPIGSNLSVSSHIFETMPDTPHFGGGHIERHSFDASLETLRLVISTSGRYRRLNSGLIEKIKPQLATVRFTARDTQRLLENARKTKNSLLIKHLEKVLTPREVLAVGLNSFASFDFQHREIIEAAIPIKLLPIIEGLLAKPLSGERRENESRINQLIRYFDAGQLLKGDKSEILKDIVSMLKEAQLGILFDQPVLTADQAEKFLKEELRVVEEYYVDHGITVHAMPVERPVFLLARENLGDEFVDTYRSLEDEDKLAYLISKGYKIPDDYKKHEEELRKLSPRLVSSTARLTLPYHLFQFVKQVCLADLKSATHKYRERYVTSKPKLRIVSEVDIDTANTAKIKLPDRAKLFSLVLQEPKGSLNGLNELCFYNTDPNGNSVLFRSRIGLDSPSLLNLQEQACNEMGISFT